jgi:uncharacterized membrane protein YoaK (UPF0700 family)
MTSEVTTAGDSKRTDSDRGSPKPPLPSRRNLLLLGLSWAAGFVDAISFLGLGSVFTANMTGNTILLAIALARRDLPGAFRSLIALAGFCLGVIAGALIAPHRDDPPISWLPAITKPLVLEFAALLGLAVGWHWAGALAMSNTGFIELLIIPAAFAMGVQTAAVRRIGVSAVTSTAVTGTLAGVMASAVGLFHASTTAPPGHVNAPSHSSAGFGLSASVWGIYAAGGLAGGLAQIRWNSNCAWPAVVTVGIVSAAVMLSQRTKRDI